MQSQINEAWKSTCRTLLGEEVGGLSDFEPYLSRHVEQMAERKSSYSGKGVFASERVCEGARFMSDDERPQYSAAGAKLDINEIKDLDSLVFAAREKFVYSGNIVLGNSSGVEKSDRCADSVHVYKSRGIVDGSKFLAFSDQVRVSEYAFGTVLSGEVKSIIHSYEVYKTTRCMEGFYTWHSSDCYFTANLQGCRNCMFSFNLRNRSDTIGNLQLPKDKYVSLKKKLLAEIADELRRKKTIIGIAELLELPKRKLGGAPAAPEAQPPKPQKEVESAFRSTFTLLLGKPPSGLQKYEQYLASNSGKITTVKSATGSGELNLPPLEVFHSLARSALTEQEALEMGKSHLSEGGADSLSIKNAPALLADLAYATPDLHGGKNLDIVHCACYDDSSHAYSCSFAYSNKMSAYSYWPRDSEHVFGCRRVFFSNYCIACHDSVKLSRCMEVDASHNCRDSYFCHNCEGLDNCMFCFNAKSLKYAVANVEVGKEEYMRIRKIVLDSLAYRMEKSGSPGMGIFTLGCAKAQSGGKNVF